MCHDDILDGKSIMRMKYHVYENWLHDKAIIHKSDCVYCKDGKGMFPDRPYNKKNGQWWGPFTYTQAAVKAIKTGKFRVNECSICLKGK